MAPTGHLAPGDLLGDRYALRKPAWTSALGPIWEARDRVLGRPVFVQLLSPDLARDEGVRRTFQRAAGRIAQIQHAALLRVFDIGEDPPFVVFEHASGGRLSDRLARGTLRTTEAVRAALSIARGLEALHAAGVSHGSLSPTCVLFDPEGRARVLVLGAAETTTDIPGVDARDEQPEGYRVTGEPPGPDQDRYALAALTHHMLTGKAPSRGVRRIGLPGGLSSLLQRALDPEPTLRPSLDSFIAGLAPFARVEPPKARRPRAVISEFRWLTPVIVIVVLAVLAVTIGVSVLQRFATSEDEPTPTPTPTLTAGPIEIASVAEFDPHGSGQERPARVRSATDGDAATSWATLDYASIGFDKPGVGLLFDLGSSQPIALVELQTGLPGWEAQIRIGDEAAPDENGFEQAATFTAERETSIELPAGSSGRYVLLWITRAVRHEGEGSFPHRAEVAEIRFHAG